MLIYISNPDCSIRRVNLEGTVPRLDVRQVAPASEDLRGLAELKRDDLRSRAEARNLAPEGSKVSRDAWLRPLQRLADAEIAAGSGVTTWISVDRELAERLPVYLPFSSPRNPTLRRRLGRRCRQGFGS
jgi:hypothetical protein